jgi:hypothetical protein
MAHMTVREQHAAEDAVLAARRQAERKAEAAENEHLIAKRERELDALAASLSIDPPPELPPAERKERELAERIAALEGKQLPQQPQVFNSNQAQRRNRLIEDLRLREHARAVDRQDERDREHAKCCRRQASRLQEGVEEADADLAAEDQRHAQARAGLAARRDELSGRLVALLKPLGEGETTKDRLEAVAV